MTIPIRRYLFTSFVLFATAAGAIELPIKGEYGDDCGGTRQGSAFGPHKSLWDKPMSARGFGLWGDGWRCEFVGADDLPVIMAEMFSDASPARGWVVRAVCQGLRPVETFIVVAYVEKQSPAMLVIHGGGDFRMTFGLCPIRSYLRPAR